MCLGRLLGLGGVALRGRDVEVGKSASGRGLVFALFFALALVIRAEAVILVCRAVLVGADGTDTLGLSLNMWHATSQLDSRERAAHI